MDEMQTKDNIYTRTEMLLGPDSVERLRRARVIIFGVGGVGGYAAEALCRTGVGKIALCDFDRVSVSNLNRQIIATEHTLGVYKTEAARDRLLCINANAEITLYTERYTAESADGIDLSSFDLILDCIDELPAKLELIRRASVLGVPIISSMGAGNKLDPTRFTVTDISKTHTDPLARAVRSGLRKMGINHLPVVFSDEPPVHTGTRTPGSVAFAVGAAGLAMASFAVRELLK